MEEDANARKGTLLDELQNRIADAAPKDGHIVPIPGLRLTRQSAPSMPIHGVSHPSVCLLAQGSKTILLGEDSFHYHRGNYLIITAELPIIGQIVDAAEDRPFLGAVLELDPALIGSVMVESGQVFLQNAAPVKAMAVNELDEGLLDAVVRYVRLIESPKDARVLVPLVKREIVYRLLQGKQGPRLRQIASLSGYSDGITMAIERLRGDFDKPLRMENIADDLGMSLSSFYSRFKAVTAMSPLQYQKQLRLQEARRLLLNGDFDAASAGFKVGYDDASQFSREYKRFFGAPPMSDVKQFLRGEIAS
ncbi:MAG: AraC family transcriptional regulator [Capsulimonadaceae bacterium]|nr:AraC family transcriptional regulator [Capsulimonadaceae bacterium]